MCNCTPDSPCRNKSCTLVVNGTVVCSGRKDILEGLVSSVMEKEPDWTYEIIEDKCECNHV